MRAESELDTTLERLEVFGVRLGLDTTRRLLSALDDPQDNLRAVLVGGTNGKGSTAALLSSMVQAGGYRVGLYTSPHLESVEERLRIDGRAVGTEELTALVAEVVSAAEDRLGYLPTYFEALTAAAFLWFARQEVDLAILEVGLGGRLDATNGCEPLVSLITEIGLEHQRYLGPDLASIGREKAGILRPGRTGIAWVERPEARHSIQQVADEVGARLIWASDRVTLRSQGEPGWEGQRVELETTAGRYELRLPLPGEHQIANLVLATLAAEELAAQGMERLQRHAIEQGVASSRWPGRLEWIHVAGEKPVLLDVAHNPDGGQALRRSLDRAQGSYVLLFGALADKKVDRFLPRLAEKATRVILTAPSSPRALAVEELAAMAPASKTALQRDSEKALAEALDGEGDFVVVCGSVYLVGEIRILLRRRFGVPRPATESLYRQR